MTIRERSCHMTRYLLIALFVGSACIGVDADPVFIDGDPPSMADADPQPPLTMEIPCRNIGIVDNYNDIGVIRSRTEFYSADLGPELPVGRFLLCAEYLQELYEPKTTCDSDTVSCSVFTDAPRSPIRCKSVLPMMNYDGEFTLPCGYFTHLDGDGDGDFETKVDTHGTHIKVF